MSEEIRLTRVKKHDGALLCKRIFVDENGRVQSDGSPCAMSRGTAERVCLNGSPAANLSNEILDLGQHEALVLGDLADGLPDKIKLEKDEFADPARGAYGRTRQTFQYRPGQPAAALLDHDQKAMPEAARQRLLEVGGFEGALASLVAGFTGLARVSRASTSAGIFNRATGERFPGSGGLHVYVFVKDGTDIPRFLEVLQKHAWLAGFGWIMVGGRGRLLVRSIVDTSVGLPERLVFEGPPQVIAPLAQDHAARQPRAYEGALLDTLAACPPLTAAEERRFADLVGAAKHAAKPQADEAIEKAAGEIARERSIDLDEARTVVSSSLKGELTSHDMLQFDDGAVASIADVLADPERYHERTLADPVEGLAYGRQKAKVFRNANGSVVINSFAHGGIVYRLRLNPAKAKRPAREEPQTHPGEDGEAPRAAAGSARSDPAPPKASADQVTVAPDNADDRLFGTSHDALALTLGQRWTGARHVALWGRWLFWTGARWEPDEKLVHLTRTREFLRLTAEELVDWAAGKADPSLLDRCKAAAKTMRSAQTVGSVIGLARSNAELVAVAGQWDHDAYLLGTPGGTVDLRTGKLRAARPADYITKLTSVTPARPGTDAPLWRAFVERVFRHDLELVPFVQRALGYALTGESREHVLFFAWGQGGNGKGVLLNTASRLLGDYAAIAPQDLLLATQSDRHPCDMAMLRGARLVTAQELAPGRAWDEPKLKGLTGGDPITARFVRQDFFTYEPQFSLFVAGNHKPSFRGVDEAIRRRVLLLPFLQNIPADERDQRLPEKLKAEWPAILRWMIDGCLEWQRDGLRPPASVRAATADYMNAEDVLGQFLDEKCIVSARIGWTSLARLYAEWKAWCEARGQHPGSSTALSKKLDERGFQRSKTKLGAGFVGIGLAVAPSGDGNDGPDHNDRMCAPAGARAHMHSHVDYGADHHFRHPALDDAPDDPPLDQSAVDEGVLI